MTGHQKKLLKARIAVRDHFAELWQTHRDTARAHRHDTKYSPTLGVNVVGVGIGEKFSRGRYTGKLGVTVFVAKKYPLSRVKRADFIPVTAGNVPTDVVEIGYPVSRAPLPRRRLRPVQPGTSISPEDNLWDLAGTFGVVVTDRAGKHYILSNNHVLTDENRLPIGTRILQQGQLDGGLGPGDRVAKLTQYVPLKFDNKRNWMDAAVARLYSSVPVDKTILGIGVPRSAGRPRRNMKVRKSGRTTGVTSGIIRELKVDVPDMEFDNGFVSMEDVMSIESPDFFSKTGDSGSAIVNENDRVVGLLYGGSKGRDFAIPVQRILRRFQMRILP